MARVIERFFDYFSRVTGIMMEQRILGAVVIIVLFAILAILVDFFIHRIVNYISNKSKVEIDNTFIGSIHRPAWIILLLIGALISVMWLNLDQRFNFIVNAILKTLLILVGAVGLGRLMKSICHQWWVKRRQGQQFIHLFENVGRVLVLLAAAALLLLVWKIDVSPLLASAGIVGLAVALANIDEVIALIKASSSRAEAREELMRREWTPGIVTDLLQRSGAEASRPDGLETRFGYQGDVYRLSEAQAQAILDLRLHQLTGLEQDKIVDEYKQVIERIGDLLDILNNPDRLMQVIRDELIEVREQFGDERRTEISSQGQVDFNEEDLIPHQRVVVTLSNRGFVKRVPAELYSPQHRGGKGVSGMDLKEGDYIEHLHICSTHDYLLFFTNQILGQVARKHSQVEEQEIFDFWVQQLELDDPQKFLPRLSKVLEVLIGDSWWYDRSELREKIPA